MPAIPAWGVVEVILKSIIVSTLLAISVQGTVDTPVDHTNLIAYEVVPNSVLSSVTQRNVDRGIREHYGNPDYFMKYIIQKPPVYA